MLPPSFDQTRALSRIRKWPPRAGPARAVPGLWRNAQPGFAAISPRLDQPALPCARCRPGLPRHLGVERCHPARRRQAERRRQIGRLRQRIVRPQPLDQTRVNGVSILGQGGDQNADAGAPPRFRIRLRIAVPWVMMWRGRVDNAMMFRGTWVQPRPKPCPEMTTDAMLICSENWLICHIAAEVIRRPNRMISRLSTPGDQRGDEEHRGHAPDAARHGHQPGGQRRIVMVRS
jgi:hypothetical protein